jgi:hypothetical protein
MHTDHHPSAGKELLSRAVEKAEAGDGNGVPFQC